MSGAPFYLVMNPVFNEFKTTPIVSKLRPFVGDVYIKEMVPIESYWIIEDIENIKSYYFMKNYLRSPPPPSNYKN